MSWKWVGALCLSMLCAFTRASAGDDAMDDQIYTASVSQVVQAVKMALGDIGRGVLGADMPGGMVASTAKQVRPADVADVVQFDDKVEVITALVVLVTSQGADTSEVEVFTVIRGRSPKRGFVGGGVYARPTQLADSLIAALKPYLLQGHLRPSSND